MLEEPKALSPATDPQSAINLSYQYPPPHYLNLTVRIEPHHLGPQALNYHLHNSEITFHTVQVLLAASAAPTLKKSVDNILSVRKYLSVPAEQLRPGFPARTKPVDDRIVWQIVTLSPAALNQPLLPFNDGHTWFSARKVSSWAHLLNYKGSEPIL